MRILNIDPELPIAPAAAPLLPASPGDFVAEAHGHAGHYRLRAHNATALKRGGPEQR